MILTNRYNLLLTVLLTSIGFASEDVVTTHSLDKASAPSSSFFSRLSRAWTSPDAAARKKIELSEVVEADKQADSHATSSSLLSKWQAALKSSDVAAKPSLNHQIATKKNNGEHLY